MSGLEFLSGQQLAERWKITPELLAKLGSHGVRPDTADGEYALCGIEALENGGLHTAALAKVGAPIEGRASPVIVGEATGPVTFF